MTSPIELNPDAALPQTGADPAIGLCALQGAARNATVRMPGRALLSGFDPVTRIVLVNMLKRFGIAAACAATEAEAESVTVSASPELVLIDCDNDERAAYAQARKIREASSGTQPAIIAVTGATSTGQRRARKAAGFDNYLARPLRLDALQSILARYALAQPRQTGSGIAIDQQALADLSHLLDYDIAALTGLYRQYLTLASDSLAALRTALDDEDRRELVRNARKLRACSGQIGARRVQDVCMVVETLSAAGALDGLEDLMNEVSLAFEQVGRELHDPDFSSRCGQEREGASFSRNPSVPAAPGHVLVAEPDSLTARFLSTTLRSGGFQVVTASDGHEALTRAEQLDFQALLVAGDLPGLDGYDLLPRVRQQPVNRRTPVVLLSRSTHEHDMLRAFDLGADDYIMKPLNPIEVLCRVRRFLK